MPEDFDQFWSETFEEAQTAPLEFSRSFRRDFEHPTHIVESITFRGIDGQPKHGWIAYPEGARRAPGFLWVAPYGRESKLPDMYGTRDGFTSMSFNFHGEPAFHQEKYVVARGYFARGVEEPSSWIMRRMFQDAVIATRILQTLPEADEDRLAAMGMSQGAGISIWLGAMSSIIRTVVADMPFLGAVQETLSGSVYRYPTKEIIDFAESIPLGMERVLNTVSYFDTMNVATRCNVPVQVSVGLRDPASKPDNVRSIFNALPGEKELVSYDWGHDWHPEMVENNRRWLTSKLG